MIKQQSLTISVVSRLLDVLIVWFTGVLAYYFRFDLNSFPIPVSYSALIFIGGLLVAVLFPLLKVYHSWRARGLWAPTARVMAGWSIVFIIVLTLLVIGKEADAFSRLWLSYWGVMTATVLVALRMGVYAWLRRIRSRGYNRRHAVVVGCGQHAKALIQQSRVALWAGYEVVSVYDYHSVGGNCEGLRIGTIDELADFVEEGSVDEVWVALPLDQSDKLRDILNCLRFSSVTVRYAPDLFGLFLLNHGVTEILSVPMIDLTASPMVGLNRLIKALEDRLFAAFILVLTSPLLLLISLGVRFSSPGPIFYRQKRHGWDGSEIEVWKFRTMYVHREEAQVVTQAKRDDPRVTPFGKFLRRTSLDEMPQFINVIQGHMSVVGPRPHAVEHNDTYKNLVDNYMLRLKVKPGITGWAQINGLRGETDTLEKMKNRVEHDLYYIEHWSLALDLKILFLTLFRGFIHRNAY